MKTMKAINERDRQIKEGDKIYHPDYGYGIMKEKPTFDSILVLGIKHTIKKISEEEYQKGIAVQRFNGFW